jgi:hypothetical protein
VIWAPVLEVARREKSLAILPLPPTMTILDMLFVR